jgi:phage shock protein A
MALITRISRLFRADFHAVLDQLEEPELLLRQAIREMEDDLSAREQKIRLTTHEREQLRTRRQELERSLAELDGELELCFASHKDDLARNLIRRKLEAERLSRHLASRDSSAEKQLAEECKLLEEHRMTLEGFRQKAEIFARRPRALAGAIDATDILGRELVVSDDEVEVAFLREQSKRKPS